MSFMVYDAMEPMVLMERKRVSDGEGGFIGGDWEETVEFEAAVTTDQSMQTRVAEAQGVTSVYTVYTPKTALLLYHDVFKRLSDGKIFRATSESKEIQTPDRASFQFAVASAEAWELTQ